MNSQLTQECTIHTTTPIGRCRMNLFPIRTVFVAMFIGLPMNGRRRRWKKKNIELKQNVKYGILHEIPTLKCSDNNNRQILEKPAVYRVTTTSLSRLANWIIISSTLNGHSFLPPNVWDNEAIRTGKCVSAGFSFLICSFLCLGWFWTLTKKQTLIFVEYYARW